MVKIKAFYTYIKGPFNCGLARQIGSTLELVVVALPERLRSIRDVTVVAEDRQPGAHPQSCVLSNVLRQDNTEIVIRIRRRYVLQEYGIVVHGLKARHNRSIAIDDHGGVLIPHNSIVD